MVALSSTQAVALTAALGLVVVGGVGFVVLSGQADAAAVDQVPDGVDTVVRIDMAITNDTVTQELASAGLNTTGPAVGGPRNLSAVGGEVDNRTDLDPRAISEVVVFGEASQPSVAGSDEEYVGVVVHADWETEAFLESVEEDTDGVAPTEYERTTYNGQTVLEPVGESADDEWVGVLGDGQFVLGSEDAVEDTIDVATGEDESFDGRLRSAYEDAPEGLVQFALEVPEDAVPAEQTGGVDTGSYQSVETIAGSYYTTQTGAGIEVRMRASGTEGARDVADVTDGALAIAAGTVGNETAQDALRAVEVERDGQVVTVSYEQSVGTVEALLRYLYRNQLAYA